jgi:sulfonate transport system substrate-binding protein
VIGGVPEHFNAPFHLGIKDGIFAKHGVDVEFKEIPEGTGKMCAGLRDGSLDVAVLLTEGIIRDIVQGSTAKLVGTYVHSPLTWAILTKPNSDIKSADDLKGKNIGISRIGSGSHLMAMVLADDKDWSVDGGDLKFTTLNDFKGLSNGVRSGEADAFLWETFMTKPYVDRGELGRAGDIVTPWPCFMIAASHQMLEHNWIGIQNMLAAIQESCARFKAGGAESVNYVADRHGLTHEDAQKWFEGVKYATSSYISRRVLVKTVEALIKAKILPKFEDMKEPFSFAQFYDPRVKLADVNAIEIQTMKLAYDTRLRNILKAKGKETGPLSEADLLDSDQLHYHGAARVDHAAKVLNIQKGEKVIDIGSGLGGPARYLASKYGAQVCAVEIETARQQLAQSLTDRCQMSSQVTHVLGDASTVNAKHLGPFDHFVSWLSILHIKNRKRLFDNIAAHLKQGATFVIEDFVKLKPFTAQEISDLEIVVACPYVPSREEYVQHLTESGFSDIQVHDLTEDWRQFVHERLVDYKINREKHVAVHGEKVSLV